MKRHLVVYLVLVGAVLLFSVPVFAEDRTLEERVTDLEKTFGGIKFYGSMRMGTFYNDMDTGPGMDDRSFKADLQSNSRIGATFTRDKLIGLYELGLDDDNSVITRKLYGVYDMGWGSLLVGQNNPIFGNMFYSNQVVVDDLDLCGWGAIFETRLPQVKLKVKGLEIALIRDKSSSALNAATGTGNSGDVDVLMPKIEVGYHIDQARFFADVFGGAFSFKVQDVTLSGVNYGDETVNCWVAGVGGGLKLDPAYVKAQVYYAQNGKNFGIIQQDAVGAQFDAAGSVVNETNVGTHLVVGSKVGACTVEAGFGYAYSQLEDPVGTYSDGKNTVMSYYLNAVVPVYGAFFIVPEVGVLDYGDNSFGDDEKKSTRYIGAKWQVDF
ncbi:MAG TPA: hypothetical protein PKM41_08465 [Deltaproteobacteria bacterium]|nr:hypothetical protein [Deltaproteobacteria bacterium]HOI07344.1 hypothetical protein [Deltaproteobacteria bacterium]